MAKKKKPKRADSHTNALCEAAKKGDAKKVKSLLDKDAEVNAGQSDDGYTALHMAGRHPRILEMLIQAGASVHTAIANPDWSRAKLERGETPLHWAASPKSIQLLLDNGADLHARSERGFTVLHSAADKKRQGVIKTIVQLGLDVDCTDNLGHTPLHFATHHVKTLQALLDAGADFTVQSQHGRTPLHVAATQKNPEGMRALIQAGADVNATCAEGKTPLHMAIARVDNVKILIEAGAKHRIKTKDKKTPGGKVHGRTALDLARIMRFNATFNYLSSLGKKKKAPALPEKLDWPRIENILYDLAAKGLSKIARSARGKTIQKLIFDTNAAYGDFNLVWFLSDSGDEHDSLEVGIDPACRPHQDLIAQKAESSDRVIQEFLRCATRVMLRLEADGALDALPRASDFKALVLDHDETEKAALRRLARIRKSEAATSKTSLKIDLKGKNVVFTGTAPIPRKDLTALLKVGGAMVQSSVGASTDVLLCADKKSSSSKLTRAKKQGVKILEYTQAIRI